MWHIYPFTHNIKEQIILSCPHTLILKYKSTGEKLLKYHENSPWVIIILNCFDPRVE